MMTARHLAPALYTGVPRGSEHDSGGGRVQPKLPQVTLTNTMTQQGKQGLLPGYVANKLLVVHYDAQLAGPGRKHVQWLWE